MDYGELVSTFVWLLCQFFVVISTAYVFVYDKNASKHIKCLAVIMVVFTLTWKRIPEGVSDIMQAALILYVCYIVLFLGRAICPKSKDEKNISDA